MATSHFGQQAHILYYLVCTKFNSYHEEIWRDCIRTGSMVDFIMAGGDFVDQYRKATKDEVDRYTILSTMGEVPDLDAKVGKTGDWGVRTGLKFGQIPIYWNPVFDELQSTYSPGTDWRKRCYFIACSDIQLRPMDGYTAGKGGYAQMGMQPKVYDRYTFFWYKKSKLALTARKFNSQAALAIA